MLRTPSLPLFLVVLVLGLLNNPLGARGVDVALTWLLPHASSAPTPVQIEIWLPNEEEAAPFDQLLLHECIRSMQVLSWTAMADTVPRTVRLSLSNSTTCDGVQTSLTLYYHGYQEDPPTVISRHLNSELLSDNTSQPVHVLSLLPLYRNYLLEVFRWKQERNTALQAEWDGRANAIQLGTALVSSNALNDRRHRAPLKSFFLCQATELGASVWQIVNLDTQKAYSILTITGQIYTVPPAGSARVIHPRAGPFGILENVAQWIGDARWSDGLITSEHAIYPATAPSSSVTCFCNYTVDCRPVFAGKRWINWSMLPSDAATENAATTTASAVVLPPVFGANQEYALATVMALNTSLTPFNTILILIAIFFSIMGLFLYIRDGGIILPDTPAARAYRATIVNDPRDDEYRALQEEQAYVQGLRDRVTLGKRTGLESDSDSESSSSRAGGDIESESESESSSSSSTRRRRRSKKRREKKEEEEEEEEEAAAEQPPLPNQALAPVYIPPQHLSSLILPGSPTTSPHRW